ncbi:unnamed protein product [Camellia sinensis]
MIYGLINANPIVYEEKEHRTRTAPDDVDKDIKDPEHPYSLEELKVISEDAIEVDDKHNCVRVTFTPTVEHCSMVTVIGLCLRVKLMCSLLMRYKHLELMQVKLYRFDNEPRSPGDAPQGEDNKEIDRLFKSDKKNKKGVRSVAEIALLVENVMAKLEVVAEEDAELNRQSKPATTKLKKPPLLMEVLSKKQLHHGVLTLLKTWLKPLPDGSLPNINIRGHYDRREKLKKSGLGKVIMFLLKSDEETTTNRRMAKALVDKWSRPIFNKSTRFEDMRNFDDEKANE